MTLDFRPGHLRRLLPLLFIAFLLSFLAGCAVPKTRYVDTIKIQGTQRFDEQVVSALVLLKNKSPDAYETVTNYVGLIRQSRHSGMDAERQPPTFQLNDRTAFYSVTWCAGSIAHDSFHSKLYHDYRAQHRGSVPDQIWTGADAERQCVDHQFQTLKAIGAPVGEINYCLTTRTNNYWQVDYSRRDW